MITYELAKKLKDAGFPQEILNEVSIRGLDARTRSYHRNQDIYYPTLEELIEACGEEGFEFLSVLKKASKNPSCGSPSVWQAAGPSDGMGENRQEGFGDSPSEAVANLWLALNKK